MKFSCGRCGKRYATAEMPAPGRVYKIRCKACGHLIVVKGAAPGSAAGPPLADGWPAPVARPGPPAPPPPEPGLTPARLAAALQRPDETPTPAEPFVDLFDDAEPVGEAGAPGDAPFLATATDPFAPGRGGLRAPTPGPVGRAPGPAPTPLVARPAQRKGRGPVVLIGLGGLVLVGILAFVLLGGRGPAQPLAVSPAPPQGRLQAPPPPPTPAHPSPVPAPSPAAGAAAPERLAGAGGEGGRDEKHARSREKADRFAREVRVRDRQRLEAAAPPAPVAPQEGSLTQAQIKKVLAASRKTFQACIAGSSRSGDVKLDGRRVTLRLNVQSSGAVAYPSIDDPTLNGTDLGSCLKSSARMMVFPSFVGETLRVDVPLVLAAGR